MDEKDFEIAALAELMERESAIIIARRAAALSPRPVDFDGSCPECGGDIPDGRVAAGYFVCVDCVGEKEHRKRLTGI
jgi:RNA polymerase-binding transcription factor DksA